MHDIHTDHALVVIALVSSAVLLAQSSERLFAGIALCAAAVEAAIQFHIITLAVHSVRLDIVLPALLVIGGGIAWWRTAGKSQITAATLITMVGVVQLAMALRLLD